MGWYKQITEHRPNKTCYFSFFTHSSVESDNDEVTPTSTEHKLRSTEAVFTGEIFAAVQTPEEESCSPSHSLCQACVNSHREGGERDEREGYSYCLPPDGFFALSRFGYRIHKEPPSPLSWPYIARFNISWQLRGGTAASSSSSSSGGGGSIKRVSWSGPEAAQTSTCCATHTHTQNRVQ